MNVQESILGRCLALPFRRGGSDFDRAEGEELVRGALHTILSTTCASPTSQGEVRFNQRLGTLLESVRHAPLDDPTTLELIRYYVEDALEHNEPRVAIHSVSATRDPSNFRMTLRIRYEVISRDVAGNRVVQRDLALEVDA
jgi:phage baseplate assembly protein W